MPIHILFDVSVVFVFAHWLRPIAASTMSFVKSNVVQCVSQSCELGHHGASDHGLRLEDVLC